MKWTILLFLVGFSMSISGSISGEELKETITFSLSEVSFEKLDGYDIISVEGCELMHRVGAPSLPVKTVHTAIPKGTQVKDVIVTCLESEELPGRYFIHPAQPHKPISESSQTEFVEPDPSIYQSSSPYPEKPLVYRTSGYLSGHGIASLLISPFQYSPSQGTIILHKKVEFKLILEESEHPRISRRSVQAEKLMSNTVKSLVINPQDVEEYVAERLFESPLQAGLLEYVIITKSYYFEEFQELIDWKTKKGLTAVLRDINWVLANYPGDDDPEILRNYIKDLYVDSGTVWVLLGGDGNALVVPYRGAYCQCGDETDYLPCDYYYSNLDGTWDSDGDHIYGEVNDDVDFYPDIWIGRATVDSDQEITRFVNKVLTYEKDCPTDYQTKALFFTAHLDAQTDPKELKEYIDNTYMPGYFDIDYLSDVSHIEVRDSLNLGYNIANHDGHGNTCIMCTDWQSDWLSCSDMYGLTNAPRYTILYSCGCNCGYFDSYSDCIGEKFFEAPNGGGFFVGNSRLGWGNVGNPTGGPSPDFDESFFRSLFNRNQYHLGQTLGDSKSQLATMAQNWPCYRWVYYGLNLLGDPEMPIWTDSPDSLDVTHPDTVFVGESDPFTVTVYSSGSPVPDALVCLWKGDEEIHLTDETNSSGIVTFYPSPLDLGTLWVTVTKRNYIPYASSAIVHGCSPPHAEFSADTTIGFAPLEVHFSDQSTGSIDDWYWQFGDGDTSWSRNPIHTYENCGRFDITLIVCNPTTCNPVFCDTITKEFFIWIWADTMIVQNTSAAPGQAGKKITIGGVNCDPLSGYGLAMYFDTAFLDVDTVTFDGTCGEGAQISLGGVGFDTSLGLAYVTWGVVYAWTPPWIPPGSHDYFNVMVTIKDSASLPSFPCTTSLNLENDVGLFNTDNTFTTWDDLDIHPILVDGDLIIRNEIGFIRGDCTSTGTPGYGDGTIAMSDAIYILKWLYVPGTEDFSCFDAADVNDDADIAMSDGIYLLKYLYVPGEPPPPPPCCVYPYDCGTDPAPADTLDCVDHPCAGGRASLDKPEVDGEMILGAPSILTR